MYTIFFKEMYTFIRQGRIILIESDKDMYNAFDQNNKDWSNDAVNTACITNDILQYI